MANIVRKYHTIDATDKVFGRLATMTADLLRGKKKVTYQPNIDDGDFVTIINISKIKYTGKKLESKYYRHFSGYQGGLKETQYKKLVKERPQIVFLRAVYRMLPDTRLRKNIIKRLTVKD